MKQHQRNIQNKLRFGLLVPIIALFASLSEMSVQADEVKARHTPLQATPPETPTRSDHTDALREIDLKVALKQYEEVVTEVENTKLQVAHGPEEEGLSEQQIAEWRTKQERKQALLEGTVTQLRAKIERNLAEQSIRHRAAQPESTRQPMAEQYGFPNTGGFLLQATPPETPTRSDHTAVLREIDLKVAIKQYEKVASQVEDTKLQSALGPEEKGLSDHQMMQWKHAQDRKQAVLEVTAMQLRDKIEQLVAEANREAEACARRAADRSSRSSPAPKGSSPEASPMTPPVK